MKSLKKILKQTPIFLHNWKSKIDVISDFDNIYMTSDEYNAETAPYQNVEIWLSRKAEMKVAIEEWKPINILFASYGQSNYSADAFVLFERDKKLFEVNCSHCHCSFYGLEGKWSPEETTLEAIEHRLIKGSMGTDSYSDNEFAKELKEFLGIS